MTQWRVPLGLFLIGMFMTTLKQTIYIRIQLYAFSDGITTGIHNWRIYLALFNIIVSISMIVILIILTKKEQNHELVYIRDILFVKALLKHFIIYMIGYLTLPIILLIRYNLSGESVTEEFYNDIISIYGLVDFETLTLGLIIDDQFKFILADFVLGASSSILPMFIIITSNIINSQSITKHNDEALYPQV